MSIFEYDKELEEKKLRKAEYEAGFSEGEKHGHETGFSEGEKYGIELNSTLPFLFPAFFASFHDYIITFA